MLKVIALFITCSLYVATSIYAVTGAKPADASIVMEDDIMIIVPEPGNPVYLIEVYDMSGKPVITAPGCGSQVCMEPVDKLESGIYIVKLHKQQGTSTHKVYYSQ